MNASEIELDVNPADVCKLIELARDFHTQEAVVLPDETSDQDLDMSGIARDGAPTHPVRDEFRTIVADLEPRQQIELAALLRLGRGDFTVEEWDARMAETGDAWSGRMVDELLDQPLLADHLSAGLERLGHSCD
ncbi:DUF3775 domain-containing protein [Wenzhouxiangella limi]|uniref:DUF3775 domain-containing protein n=1 Tax=Wenzhouxiangella limi TaxID=2707351 RepID=A0A845V2C3_9GAMM|nr:DUF3775 domain-containing protein [Wenzhouxiangella limi]NDY94155.1 DUF3775 domain-containing protein [Wenzhouxiangella limi]